MSVPPEDNQTRHHAVATGQQASLRWSVTRHSHPTPPEPATIEQAAPSRAEPTRARKPGKRRPKPDQTEVNRVALELCEQEYAKSKQLLKKRPVLERLLHDRTGSDRDQLNEAYAKLPGHLKMRHGGQTKSQNEEPENSE